MSDLDDSRPAAVPIMEEQLRIGRRTVETDRVRVRTIVEERPETIRASIERGLVDVERVPVFREVTQAPDPREEGDTLIVAIVEERLVKRSFVIEELHIRRRSVIEQAELSAPVRVIRAEIEHADIIHAEDE